uniref:Pherophorin domain-containing protein n=1 Tax=Chlamydomonas leiostraca TaxID=1034604 RepID=A0A7S0WV20_9CHLO|mmetsp:Transcript_30219/g.77028  ORF Transcript_30219/g.77028 Transcript_30219/m.77028 type:complete len:616 (+) Transcript_30219:121-1968(+)
MAHSGLVTVALVALLAASADAVKGYTNVFPWYGSCKTKVSDNLFSLGAATVGQITGGYQRICWTVEVNEECPLTIAGKDNPCCKGYMNKGTFVEANVYKMEMAYRRPCYNLIEHGAGVNGPKLINADGTVTQLAMNWESYTLPNGNSGYKVRFTGMDLTRANGQGAQICFSTKVSANAACAGLDGVCATRGCEGSVTLIEEDNVNRHQCCPLTKDQYCSNLLSGGVCPAGKMTKPGVNLNTFVPTPQTPAAAVEQCCVDMTCADYIAQGKLRGAATGQLFSSCPANYQNYDWVRNGVTDGSTVEECCDRKMCDSYVTPEQCTTPPYSRTKNGQPLSELPGKTVAECCEVVPTQSEQKYPFPYCRCEGQFFKYQADRVQLASGDDFLSQDGNIKEGKLLLPFRLGTTYTTDVSDGRNLYCFPLLYLGAKPAPPKPNMAQICRSLKTLHRIEILSKPECTKTDFDAWYKTQDGRLVRLGLEDQADFNKDGTPVMNPVWDPFTAAAGTPIARYAVKAIKVQAAIEAAGINFNALLVNPPAGGAPTNIGSICLRGGATGPCTNLREICGESADSKYYFYQSVEPADASLQDTVRCEWSLIESGNQRCCPTQTELAVPPS